MSFDAFLSQFGQSNEFAAAKSSGGEILTAGAKHLGNYWLAKERQKMLVLTQQHRNTMLKISANVQRNDITVDEAAYRKQDNATEEQIQVAAMKTKAAAENSAAAAGTGGASVKNVVRGIKRSELRAQQYRMDAGKQASASFATARRNLALGEAFSKDVTVFPKPSAAMALLGFAAEASEIVDRAATQLASTAMTGGG